MKKNSCTPIDPKKYSCHGLKKIHTRNLIRKKNSCGSKFPHPSPHNFSNGPSLTWSCELRYFVCRSTILPRICAQEKVITSINLLATKIWAPRGALGYFLGGYVLQHNSLLVNALNRIFKSNLSLNNFKWLLSNWSFRAFEILYPVLENASEMDTPF